MCLGDPLLMYDRLLLIMVNLLLYHLFSVIYQRFDGIILPEHTKPLIKPASGFLSTGMSYLWGNSKQSAATCENEKLSSFNYDTKKLSDLNHKQLRKNALWMHLEHFYGVLSGEKVMDNLVDTIKTVCATFTSLNKFYICSKTSSYSGNPTDLSWAFDELKMVIGF